MTSSASTMWPTHSSTDHSVGSGRDPQEVAGVRDELSQRGRAARQRHRRVIIAERGEQRRTIRIGLVDRIGRLLPSMSTSSCRGVPTRSWGRVSDAQRSRSPARMGMSSQFSGGASGHAQRGSKAHEGWMA